MNIYLLTNTDFPTFEENAAMVIAAPTQQEARTMAADEEGPTTWKDPNLSTCIYLGTGHTKTGIILRDFIK